jgi:hypothetical protein
VDAAFRNFVEKPLENLSPGIPRERDGIAIGE